MRAKPGLPKFDLDTFAEIVEGRHSCLTLKELEQLVQHDLPGNCPSNVAAEVRTHLQDCPDCGEHYQALLVLTRVAGRAACQALENEGSR